MFADGISMPTSIREVDTKIPALEDLKSLLDHCGERPINNLVDITNELTILYGMPSHIFDLDKLATQRLLIRESKDGESIKTLDNTKNALKGGDIVIEDGANRLVDLCGVMGGAEAVVDDHTKNILLIVPAYNPKKIRKTSLYLQKRTIASQIYEKQPDPELCLPVLNKAIQLFKDRAGGEVSSDVYDYYPEPFAPKIISFDQKWFNRFVGQEIPKDQIISILSGLGFSDYGSSDDIISCVVPSWRYNDINIKEDLAEEIARVYGYFRLPAIIPNTSTSPEPKNQILQNELKAKKYLSNRGFIEIFNNSLISKETISLSGDREESYLKLINSLSSDYEYLRVSLIPSLLNNIKHNQGKTDKDLNIFEISNVYLKGNSESLPDEISTVCLASTSDYRQVKGELENFLRHLNVGEISFVSCNENRFMGPVQAKIVNAKNEEVGFIGEIDSKITRDFGITSKPIMAELNFKNLCTQIKGGYAYTPISEFPYIIEDITLETPTEIGSLLKMIKSTSNLIQNVDFIETYQNKKTFKISFGSFERNLTQNEVNEIKEKIFKLA